MNEIIEKIYNNRSVSIEFIFDDNGGDLKDILEECYKDEINNKRIFS